jgi:hypothetical protein
MRWGLGCFVVNLAGTVSPSRPGAVGNDLTFMAIRAYYRRPLWVRRFTADPRAIGPFG